jgi:hypothetical protein
MASCRWRGTSTDAARDDPRDAHRHESSTAGGSARATVASGRMLGMADQRDDRIGTPGVPGRAARRSDRDRTDRRATLGGAGLVLVRTRRRGRGADECLVGEGTPCDEPPAEPRCARSRSNCRTSTSASRVRSRSSSSTPTLLAPRSNRWRSATSARRWAEGTRHPAWAPTTSSSGSDPTAGSPSTTPNRRADAGSGVRGVEGPGGRLLEDSGEA